MSKELINPSARNMARSNVSLELVALDESAKNPLIYFIGNPTWGTGTLVAPSKGYGLHLLVNGSLVDADYEVGSVSGRTRSFIAGSKGVVENGPRLDFTIENIPFSVYSSWNQVPDCLKSKRNVFPISIDEYVAQRADLLQNGLPERETRFNKLPGYAFFKLSMNYFKKKSGLRHTKADATKGNTSR